MRRGLSWLLTLPLVLAGSELAHAVGYWTAVPDAHERAQVLAATGHGYLSYGPLVAGLGVAAVVVALAQHARGAGTARLRAWPFALLPLLTFVLQEHLERLLHSGSAAGVVLQPSFVYGVAPPRRRRSSCASTSRSTRRSDPCAYSTRTAAGSTAACSRGRQATPSPSRSGASSGVGRTPSRGG